MRLEPMNSTPDTRDPASATASAQERSADNPGKRGGTIAPDMSPAAAFSTLAMPMAAQVAQRIGGLCVGADAESPHKLRVVLRRLRSLWWAYDPLIDRSQSRWQRREFKALADAAGQTRDWDILKHLLAKTRRPRILLRRSSNVSIYCVAMRCCAVAQRSPMRTPKPC
jgi:Uncharacterized conserved protein